MSTKMRYLGWTCFELITDKKTKILTDPMLSGNEEYGLADSPALQEDFEDVDLILVTHTAFDHVGQAFDILQRSQARLVCDIATASRAEDLGLPGNRIYGTVSGVQYTFDDVIVKTLAVQHHSFARVPTGYISAQPVSYLISTASGERIFFAGDTSIHGDLKLYGELYEPQVAILGVGGVSVHGQSCTELHPNEAALAAEWLGVELAIPMHYREDEGHEFLAELAARAPHVQGIELRPGDTHTFSPSGRSPTQVDHVSADS